MKNILGLALLGDSGFFSALIGVGDEGEFIGGAGAGAAVGLGRLGLGGTETLGLNGEGGRQLGMAELRHQESGMA